MILPRVLLNKEGDSVLYLKSVRVKLIRGLDTAPLRPTTSGPRGNNSLRRHHPVFHQGLCGNPHEELIPSRTEAVGLVNHAGRNFCFLVHRY